MAKRPKAAGGAEATKVRKRVFINELVSNGNNATQAAIAAGYSAKTAYSAGPRLLADVEVQAALTKRRQELLKISDITPERIRLEMARIALFDPRKLYREDGSPRPPSEWDDDTAAVIAGVDVDQLWEGRGESRENVGTTTKLRLHDKNTALEKLARIEDMYNRDNASRRPDLSIQVAVISPGGAPPASQDKPPLTMEQDPRPAAKPRR